MRIRNSGFVVFSFQYQLRTFIDSTFSSCHFPLVNRQCWFLFRCPPVSRRWGWIAIIAFFIDYRSLPHYRTHYRNWPRADWTSYSTRECARGNGCTDTDTEGKFKFLALSWNGLVFEVVWKVEFMKITHLITCRLSKGRITAHIIRVVARSWQRWNWESTDQTVWTLSFKMSMDI